MKWFPKSQMKVSENVPPYLIMPEKNEKWRWGVAHGGAKMAKNSKITLNVFYA